MVLKLLKCSLDNRAAAAVSTVKAKKYSEQKSLSADFEGVEHDASIKFKSEAHMGHHLEEKSITSCG